MGGFGCGNMMKEANQGSKFGGHIRRSRLDACAMYELQALRHRSFHLYIVTFHFFTVASAPVL